MPVARAGLIALVAIAAAGCAGEDEPATITIGTGQDSFEALVDGDEVPVIQGPQGGFHIFGSFWATGIEPGDPDNLQSPDNPTAQFRVFEGDVRVDIAEATLFTQGLEEVDGGYGTIGRLVILDITDDAELDGATVRFEVAILDVHGKSASDAVELTLYAFPGNP